jgi:type II secretory pathway predicted ATPase ExeA
MRDFSFYGLSVNPFSKQALKPKDSFISTDHREMIGRLNYLKDANGIGLFTAFAGMGKSFSLQCFFKELNPNLFKMHYVCLSTISVIDFYKQLCDLLGIDVKVGKTAMFKAIQERIYHYFKEKRCPLILAIDEAQYLNDAILRDIKMLMNYRFDSLNCFSLILSGEPNLNITLQKPTNEALRQRITIHYNFVGLNPDEVANYIFHKINIAGGAKSIMGADAINALTGFCQGNPRIIDNLMTNALILGAQLEKQVIDSEIIMAAANATALG